VILRSGELRFHGCARGRVAGRNPGFPDLVHLVEGRDVGEKNLRRQELRLVAAGAGKELVDGFENVERLFGDALARRLLRDLAGEINRIAVNDRLAHARSGLEALDGHCVSPLFSVLPVSAC
jgi:hypothetical protein